MWLRFADGETEAQGNVLRTSWQEVTEPSSPLKLSFCAPLPLSPEPIFGISAKRPQKLVGAQVGTHNLRRCQSQLLDVIRITALLLT